MRKSILTLFIILSIGFSSFGQSTKYPWAVGLGMNWADFWAVPMSVSDQLTNANWQNTVFPSHLALGRNLSKSFNLQLSGDIMKLNINDVPPFIVPDQISKEDWEETYWGAEIAAQYKFANDKILKEDFFIDPFIFAGFGLASISGTTYATQNTGIGVDIWPLPKVGINFTGAYNYVFDFDDYFHYTLGLKFRFGKAPDQDGDGIADSEDACPAVPGQESAQGCPDRDGDGIADMTDKCPDVKGTIELKGCVDTDGDGLIDPEDACPTVKGLTALKGCPDTDGDGVADKDDKCPNTPKGEKVDATGCVPDVDTDGDGVFDKLDKCANTPKGAKVNAEGCPLDTDGDGVYDYEDKCPTVAGIRANSGCPEVKPEVQKAVALAITGVTFETAKAIIKTSSNKELDNAVKVLNENPTIKLEIEGHTDSSGDDAMNLKLSQERADAVKDYLVNKGIEAKRLTAKGYGETKPIADNNTKEGRAKNRRVDFKINQQ